MTTALALFALASAGQPTLPPSISSAQDSKLQELNGRWLYVKDITKDRPVEEQQPPTFVTFGLRVEEDAVVVIRGKGSRQREERFALDGSVRESRSEHFVTRYSGMWKDGAFQYDADILRLPDETRNTLIRRVFRPTPEGLQVKVILDIPKNTPSETVQLALYQHPEDIELPKPAKAEIDDMEWLADAWVGRRRTSSIEERWGPPLGKAMLGVSRTVRGGSMSAFEYLRIVERDGGLVYIAQPGGRPPTEFVLTEMGDTRAVFENPRHDSPQRIVYELSGEDDLSASIGFIHGGRPQRFEFRREGF